MNRTYWLDLFTGTTWEEFKKHGANVSGFRYHSNFAFYILIFDFPSAHGGWPIK